MKCVRILRISPFAVRMGENTNEKNSEYGNVSRRIDVIELMLSKGASVAVK